MIIITGYTLCFGNKYPISEAKSVALWLGNDIVCTYVMACTNSLHDCGKPNLTGYVLPLAHSNLESKTLKPWNPNLETLKSWMSALHSLGRVYINCTYHIRWMVKRYCLCNWLIVFGTDIAYVTIRSQVWFPLQLTLLYLLEYSWLYSDVRDF